MEPWTTRTFEGTDGLIAIGVDQLTPPSTDLENMIVIVVTVALQSKRVKDTYTLPALGLDGQLSTAM
jgi:hypothetical protein